MRISRTTVNMAARRGVAMTITVDDQCHHLRTSDQVDTLEISGFVYFDDLRPDLGLLPADEFDALYRITDTGLFFISSCRKSYEEWPLWIKDEQHLRRLLPAIADEVMGRGFPTTNERKTKR